MNKKITAMLFVMAFITASPIAIAKDIDGRITDVSWPSKSTYSYSESIPVSANFVNTGSQGFSFWVGYSVQDANGKWWDAPAQQTTFIQPGGSGSIGLNWQPPNIAPQGAYTATVVLWTGYNSNNGLMYGELDRRTKTAAFWLTPSPPTPTPTPSCSGIIEGYVTDANTGAGILTASAGWYAATGGGNIPAISGNHYAAASIFCPNSAYTITCTAPGYEPASAVVTTDANGYGKFNFNLKPNQPTYCCPTNGVACPAGSICNQPQKKQHCTYGGPSGNICCDVDPTTGADMNCQPIVGPVTV